MRLLISALTCVITLTACGGPHPSAAQKEKQKEYQVQFDAAAKNAPTVKVGANTYRVVHVEGKEFASVQAIGAVAPYTAPEVERAGALGTGCKSTFSEGILAFLSGDINKVDLKDVSTKIKGQFKGWSVKLAC